MFALDVAMEGRARDQLWAARKALSPALRSVAPGKINEVVVVPVSRIPDLVAGVQVLARDYSLTIVTFGHAGNAAPVEIEQQRAQWHACTRSQRLADHEA